MKVLIADQLAPEARTGLEGLGLEVVEQPELGVDTLPDAVADVDILVVGSTAVTRRTLDAAERLLLVARAGAGVDAIDVGAASSRAVFVADCPGYDEAARAEHALWMLVELDRIAATRRHEEPALRRGLSTRSLGLYGSSPAARRLAGAARSLGLAVRVHAPELTPSLASEAGLSYCSSPEELFARSDFVSLNAIGDEDLPVVGADLLERLRDDGVFIATESLEHLDAAALEERVRAGRLHVGVDAPRQGLDEETQQALEGLALLEGALVTREEAGATHQASESAATAVVRTVHELFQRGRAERCVNVVEAPSSAGTLMVRHQHDPAALVAVFDVLQDEGVRVVDLEHQLFDGGEAALLHARLDAVPDPGALDRIRRQNAVLRVDLSRSSD